MASRRVPGRTNPASHGTRSAAWRPAAPRAAAIREPHPEGNRDFGTGSDIRYGIPACRRVNQQLPHLVTHLPRGSVTAVWRDTTNRASHCLLCNPPEEALLEDVDIPVGQENGTRRLCRGPTGQPARWTRHSRPCDLDFGQGSSRHEREVAVAFMTCGARRTALTRTGEPAGEVPAPALDVVRGQGGWATRSPPGDSATISGPMATGR
jgi:hypothetical protein